MIERELSREVRPPGAAAGPWPANARFGPTGLRIAGIAAEDLAGRYGTPLFVVDEDHFRSRCRSFGESFPRVMYAVKAFTARALVRIAREEGLGLLVASGGELEACLRAGADARSIAFHGNNKSDAELELAVASRIGLLIADDAWELDRIDRLARTIGTRQDVLVRVTPGVAAGTHSYIETGNLDSKFGTPIAGGLALEAIGLAHTLPGVSFRGVHAHIGSQVVRCEPYVAAVDAVLDLLAECRASYGIEADLLDLGGGFGATYTDEAPPEPFELAGILLGAVRDGAVRRGLRLPEVIVEPGRALVANAVVTLYRVGSVKRSPWARTFVAVDGGMSDNIRPMLYDAEYAVALASSSPGAAHEPVTVVGKHCESGDVLAREVHLPPVRPGDLLGFAATGAYGYSMASNYNRLGRPAVVAAREGTSRLILRREDADDLDRLEAVE